MQEKEGITLEKEETIRYLTGTVDRQEQLEKLNRNVEEADASLAQAERALEAYKTRISEESARLVKKQREDLQKRLERNVQAAAKKVEHAEKKRLQEKERQVKGYIADSTQGYKEQITALRKEVKADIKAAGIPGICKRRGWFALFMPRYLKEYLSLILIWTILAVGVPSGIYLMIPERQIWYFYVLLPICVIVTTLIYLGIAGKTVGKYREPLRSCRDKINQIHDLKRQIRKTENQIVQADDESRYELGTMDAKVSDARKALEAAREQQTRELQEFEAVTRKNIIDEFQRRSQDKLDELAETVSRISKKKNLSMELAAELQMCLEGHEQVSDRLETEDQKEKPIEQQIGMQQQDD